MVHSSCCVDVELEGPGLSNYYYSWAGIVAVDVDLVVLANVLADPVDPVDLAYLVVDTSACGV